MGQHDQAIDVLLVEDLDQQRLPARSLAAILQQAGLNTQLVHFGTGSDPAEIAELALREQPRLIIFSTFFAHLVTEILALVTHLRQAGATAHLTMTGPLPTFAYADLLAACPELDSALRGEAESSVAQLATRLKNKQDWRTVSGLAFRSPALTITPLPQPIIDLDEWPYPARDASISTYAGVGFTTVKSSQGCYHACTFCLPRAFYKASSPSSYQLRGISNLVDEISALYQQGARLFLFDDEQFLPPGTAREERVGAMEGALGERRLEIAFTIKCRADDVEEALFRRLKAMGLIRVYAGIESGCQATLDLLGKGVTVAQNAQALRLLDKLGIVADFSNLLFHPWSTLETIAADIKFLEQVLPRVSTLFTFHEVECYPETPLSERLLAKGRRAGPLWPIHYTIADPKAELLRRLNRIVFRLRRAENGAHNLVTQAWYKTLLIRRFQPEQFDKEKANALKESVIGLNRESLAVWREMLSFVGDSDNLYNANRVNEYTSDWARRIQMFDMSAFFC